MMQGDRQYTAQYNELLPYNNSKVTVTRFLLTNR